MLFTYDGIVVGRRDIGESNCFIDILTDEQGIIEATAHGVKKINSSLLGSCGLFSYATFCLNKTKQRYSVNSAKPKRSFHELGSDIEKLALGSYFAQAVKFCTPQEQAAEGSDSLVRFFAISLYEAEMARDTARLACVKAAFELRLMCLSGYRPDLEGCAKCGKGDIESGDLVPAHGELYCEDCPRPDGLPVDRAVIEAMRYIVDAAPKRIFSFRLDDEGIRRLGQVCEAYALYELDRGFASLDYYKKVRNSK